MAPLLPISALAGLRPPRSSFVALPSRASHRPLLVPSLPLSTTVWLSGNQPTSSTATSRSGAASRGLPPVAGAIITRAWCAGTPSRAMPKARLRPSGDSAGTRTLVGVGNSGCTLPVATSTRIRRLVSASPVAGVSACTKIRLAPSRVQFSWLGAPVGGSPSGSEREPLVSRLVALVATSTVQMWMGLRAARSRKLWLPTSNPSSKRASPVFSGSSSAAANASVAPFGAHANCVTGVLPLVSWRASPPSIDSTCTCARPPASCARKAMLRPSGDQRALPTPMRRLSTFCALVATLIRVSSPSQRFSFRLARASTLSTALPSGDSCGSPMRTILGRSSAEKRRSCASEVVDSNSANAKPTARTAPADLPEIICISAPSRA